jgi:hypothetical protein
VIPPGYHEIIYLLFYYIIIIFCVKEKGGESWGGGIFWLLEFQKISKLNNYLSGLT